MTLNNNNTHSKSVAVAAYEDDDIYPVLDSELLLKSSYRKRHSDFEQKSVHPADIPDELLKGWSVQRTGKRATRIRREKSHHRLLEDRVWCLFRSMGFKIMNGENCKFKFSRLDDSIGSKKIDVYAEDDEIVLVVECKSREERGRRSLQKDLQETISLQSYFRTYVGKRFKSKQKPKIIWIYASRNILWTAPDIQRAEDADVKIITENELQYFETFIRHMGPAGKFQILGEFLKNQKIPGLKEVKLPAIRGKIGGETFYSFVSTPRNLLKIAFINHQALNHPDGKPAYQRMVSSSRIKDIGNFIQRGGFFPTNILINFSDSPRFDLISNKENSDSNIKFGWVTLPSKYRSAWIIDGQHRLYGFSRLDDHYLDQNLFVLAFDKMSVHKEADLFITINHKQKSVPKSLLVSLLADIRMGDADLSTALSALASSVIRTLNTNTTSPLSRRFSLHGVPPEPTQNLTISEAVNGLRRSGLVGRLSGKNIIPGVLSDIDDEGTITRATMVINNYFEAVRVASPKRWEAGREAYICVNPGIRAHLLVISEVISYLSHKKSIDFSLLNHNTVSEYLIRFCKPIFNFIKVADDESIRIKFSRKFGEGGVKEYTYHLMQMLANEHDDFGTEEFKRWTTQSASERIDEVNQFLMKLSERLTNYVIDTLKSVHGIHRLPSDEQAFWEVGVESDRIRANAFQAQQRDKNRRKPKEAYLNIVDLEEIVKQKNNWTHFEAVFMNPRTTDKGGQKYYLGWISAFNELRNIAAHKNQLKTYTDGDLEFVDWLRSEVSPKVPE